MKHPRIQNQLGQGVIPPQEEGALIARGIHFAAYFQPISGDAILVTSSHPDIYERWMGHMERQQKQSLGLPSQYQIPTEATAP